VVKVTIGARVGEETHEDIVTGGEDVARVVGLLIGHDQVERDEGDVG
jgi:hypothetical protein